MDAALIAGSLAAAAVLLAIALRSWSTTAPQDSQETQETNERSIAEPSPASASASPGDVVDAGEAKGFARGEVREIEVPAENGEGKAGSVLVYRDENTGEFSAVASKCTHNAAALSGGAHVKGTDRIRCPLHGACYSLKTGDIEDFPCSDALRSFPCHVKDGRVVVDVDTVVKSAGVKERMKVLTAAGGKRTMDMPGSGKRATRQKKTIVIVGAGPAGLTCAEGLRQEGFNGDVVLIGKEPHAPLDRTKLSKGMAPPKGAADAKDVEKYAASIALRPVEFFAEHDIELRLGEEATALDHPSRTVTLKTGKVVEYDEIVIATGGDARLLRCPGSDLKNIHALRVPEDSRAIAANSTGKDVVIVGTSFIGMEVAAALVKRAKSVTAIGMEKVPFERVLGTRIGAAMQSLHEKNGVALRLQRVVKEYRPATDDSSAVGVVVLDDGEELPCDLVVVGAGIVPSTQWATAEGQAEHNGFKIERDGSICVDAHLRAIGVDNVWAVGDLARFPFFLTKTDIRVEHYGAAMLQGRIAAKNIVARMEHRALETFHSVPFFWTGPCFGKTVRYCGHAFGWDEQLFDGSVEDFIFSCFFTSGNTVVAVCTVGKDPLTALVAELMHFDRMCDVKTLKSVLERGEDVIKFLQTL